MNCGSFEQILHELAREGEMDAARRERAVAHTESCERCAIRLADERALAFVLKALANVDETKSAPEAAESVLLTAFREQKPLSIRQHWSRHPQDWVWRWGWTVAAAFLVVFGLIAYLSSQREPKKDNLVITPATPSPSPALEGERQPQIPENQAIDDRKIVSRNSKREPRRSHREEAQSASNRFFIRDEITSFDKDSEVATDFLLLNYDDDQTPMESGQLIRVQIPRSALVRFGLPVNVESVDLPVKADLLVGEDGMARAIRFVR